MDWQAMDHIGFPDYKINGNGDIFSLVRQRLIFPSHNQDGRPYVNLRAESGERFIQSVASLVAKVYLGKPMDPYDSTVIHKDGDRSNVHYTNLAWRSRSYAIMYHKEVEAGGERLYDLPVFVVERGTGVYKNFATLTEASVHYGVREIDLLHNLVSEDPLYYEDYVSVYKA